MQLLSVVTVERSKLNIFFIVQRIDRLKFVTFHRSVVVATVLYDSNAIVDIAQIQNRLSTNNSARATAIATSEDAEVGVKLQNYFHMPIFTPNPIPL